MVLPRDQKQLDLSFVQEAASNCEFSKAPEGKGKIEIQNIVS